MRWLRRRRPRRRLMSKIDARIEALALREAGVAATAVPVVSGTWGRERAWTVVIDDSKRLPRPRGTR